MHIWAIWLVPSSRPKAFYASVGCRVKVLGNSESKAGNLSLFGGHSSKALTIQFLVSPVVFETPCRSLLSSEPHTSVQRGSLDRNS